MSTFNAPNYLAHPPRPLFPPQCPASLPRFLLLLHYVRLGRPGSIFSVDIPPSPHPSLLLHRLNYHLVAERTQWTNAHLQLPSSNHNTGKLPHRLTGGRYQKEKTSSVVVVVSPTGRQGNCEAGNTGGARVRAVWQPRCAFMPCHRVHGGHACRVRGDFHRMRLVASTLT